LTKAVADFVNEYMVRIDDREDAKSEVFMGGDDGEKPAVMVSGYSNVRRDRANVRDLVCIRTGKKNDFVVLLTKDRNSGRAAFRILYY
jgi:hypothetical protein